MAPLRDKILEALDHDFRASADIARRAGVDATQAAPVLGHLRQHGLVESTRRGTRSLWRRRLPPANGTPILSSNAWSSSESATTTPAGASDDTDS
jgi:hypothetical protein